jgi:hypothetical protein
LITDRGHTYSISQTNLEDFAMFPSKTSTVPGVVLAQQEQTPEDRYAWKLWQVLDLGDVSSVRPSYQYKHEGAK